MGKRHEAIDRLMGRRAIESNIFDSRSNQQATIGTRHEIFKTEIDNAAEDLLG